MKRLVLFGLLLISVLLQATPPIANGGPGNSPVPGRRRHTFPPREVRSGCMQIYPNAVPLPMKDYDGNGLKKDPNKKS